MINCQKCGKKINNNDEIGYNIENKQFWCKSCTIILKIKVHEEFTEFLPIDEPNFDEIVKKPKKQIKEKCNKKDKEMKYDKVEIKNIEEMTAREIIKYVKERTGKIIKIDLKSKKSIIKKAKELLYS